MIRGESSKTISEPNDIRVHNIECNKTGDKRAERNKMKKKKLYGKIN